MNRYLLPILLVAVVAVGIVGISYADHVDPNDSDWECKKTLGMWELAKSAPHYNEQLDEMVDYNHFTDETKWLADKKCGFDVSIINP